MEKLTKGEWLCNTDESIAREMYIMLDTIETVLSGRSEYNPEDISVDYIRKLLAKARGEQ